MKEKIDKFIQQTIRAYDLPGLAVSIVQDKQVQYAAGFGVGDIETREPITNQSLFHLASISKLFVATAVMQLVEQSKIALDDPVGTYLPYFQIDDHCAEDITIMSMLSHVSGLPDVIDYQWGVSEDDHQALERYVRSLKSLKLLFPPNERFAYSNIAYDVLGDLIAKVSGSTFEEYIKTQILEPLDMQLSTFMKCDVPEEMSVSPHVRAFTTFISDLYPYNRAHAPSSTLHSNVLEMSNWTIANLDRGKFGHQKILAPSSFDELWKIRKSTGKIRPLVQNVGLSWFIGQYQGFQTLSHSGQDLGFSTYHTLLPEKGIGVTILCNAAPAPVEKMMLCILDILLGIKPIKLKPSIDIPLGKMYQAEGLDAMRNEYLRLKNEQLIAYDFDVQHIFEASAALLDCNQNIQAIEVITFGLEIAPEDAAGYELLARAHFQNGDMGQAAKSAQRSLELEPDNPFLRQQINALG